MTKSNVFSEPYHNQQNLKEEIWMAFLDVTHTFELGYFNRIPTKIFIPDSWNQEDVYDLYLWEIGPATSSPKYLK